MREAPGESRGFGGGRLAVTVARGVAVFAAAESYPSNRLTGAPGGRSLSGGLSLSTGGLGAPRALPRPAGILPLATGATRLSIAAAEASQVEVAGDWIQWQPVPLRRAENGVWYLDLAIPPGRLQRHTRYRSGMCRSIKTLRRADEPATDEEIAAAALQFVRKVSGYRKPSRANEEAFDSAVEEVAEASRRLLDAVARP